MLEDRKKIEKKSLEEPTIVTVDAELVQIKSQLVTAANTISSESVIQQLHTPTQTLSDSNVYTSEQIEDIKQQGRQEAIKDITHELDELRKVYNTELENKKNYNQSWLNMKLLYNYL